MRYSRTILRAIRRGQAEGERMKNRAENKATKRARMRQSLLPQSVSFLPHRPAGTIWPWAVDLGSQRGGHRGSSRARLLPKSLPPRAGITRPRCAIPALFGENNMAPVNRTCRPTPRRPTARTLATNSARGDYRALAELVADGGRSSPEPSSEDDAFRAASELVGRGGG
jgi:hypothetical protein